jgi:hypothetical protein
MSESQRAELQVLLAGLPGTGKTTYLALAWLAISEGRSETLSLGTFQDDREYLNQVAKQLLQCREARRTEVEEVGEMRLSLTIGAAGRPAMLRIPDLSGETWQHAVYDRAWPLAVDEAAHNATGLLVFVHVINFDPAPSIHATHAALRALGETAEGEPAQRPSERPTQVQIVDLLQLLVEDRASRPARVGVVLSAWDLTQGQTPRSWLATNAPLVDQYLRANGSWLHATVWGVSAQGGSFRDKAEREALLEMHPLDRSRVVDDAGQAAAVDAPLRWVLGAPT